MVKLAAISNRNPVQTSAVVSHHVIEMRRVVTICNRVPSVGGRDAGRDLREPRGLSQDPAPKGHG